jgi:hypothetical protein
MSSTHWEQILDKVVRILLNVECLESVSVSLETAISICGYSSDFLNYLSSVNLPDDHKGPVGKAMFLLSVFRSNGKPDFVCYEKMRDLFFLAFPALEDRQKIESCLSGTLDSVLVIMVGRNKEHVIPEWRMVAGAIFSTHSSGVYLEYICVSRARYDIYNFYWSGYVYRQTRSNDAPPEYDDRPMCWSKKKKNGIGTF